MRIVNNEKKERIFSIYIPCGAPALPPCWVIIMSSTRMSMTAVSEALWMDWRLDLRGSITPSASMSTTLPS